MTQGTCFPVLFTVPKYTLQDREEASARRSLSGGFEAINAGYHLTEPPRQPASWPSDSAPHVADTRKCLLNKTEAAAPPVLTRTLEAQGWGHEGETAHKPWAQGTDCWATLSLGREGEGVGAACRLRPEQERCGDMHLPACFQLSVCLRREMHLLWENAAQTAGGWEGQLAHCLPAVRVGAGGEGAEPRTAQ